MGRFHALAAAAVIFPLFFNIQPAIGGLGVILGEYWTANAAGDINTMVVADLNHDGWAEILGGTNEGQVIVWTADGRLLWDFKVETNWVTNISVADLDEDGSDEVLVIAAGILPTKYLYVLRADGSLWWSYSVREDLWSVFPLNIDEDTHQELLLAARRPAVLDTNGTEIPDWPGDLFSTPHVRLLDWDGDNDLEVLSFTSDYMNIIEANRTWRSFPLQLPGEIVGVEAGDIGGDSDNELAVLTDEALILLEHDGSIQWTKPLLGSLGGSFTIGRLTNTEQGDWVIASDETGITALDDNGLERWRFDAMLPGDQIFMLATHEDLLLVGASTGQVYLLDMQGHQLAEYNLSSPASFAQIADLNGDNRLEILLTTGGSLMVFGMPAGGREILARWSYHAKSPIISLDISDLDADRRAEVFLVERDGGITVLDRKGNLVWQQFDEKPPDGRVLDGLGNWLTWAGSDLFSRDGRGKILWGTYTSGTIRSVKPAIGEIAVLTENSRVTLHSIEDGRSLCTIDLRSPVFDLLASEAGFIISQKEVVVLLDANCRLLWQTGLNLPIQEISPAPRGSVVVRSPGHLIKLNADGSIQWDWKAQPAERITSVDVGDNIVAVGSDARAIALDKDGSEVWSQPFGEVVSAVVAQDANSDGEEEISLGTVNGSVIVLSSVGEEIWRGKGRERVNVLAVADVDADALPEILVGFEDGVVTAYGFVLDQPPWLGEPTLTAVGGGYQYSVKVRYPEGKPFDVTAEIWDPSASAWVSLGSTTASAGDGTLTWNVPNPFDTWDSCKDSAFRFVWEDRQGKANTAAFPGPLCISVAPWFVTYGRIAGLAGLILAAPILLTVIIRRTLLHRRSTLGQAEVALLRLLIDPNTTMLEFHHLIADPNQALTLLDYMPGLARQAGESALGDLLEGSHLALTRREVMVEALRTITDALQRLEKLPHANVTRQFYALMLQALSVNSISLIVELRNALDEMGDNLRSDEYFQIPTTAGLKRLASVARTFRASEQIEASDDRIVYLAEALADLIMLDRVIKDGPINLESQVIASVTDHWHALITETLEKLRGRAEVELNLRTRQLVLQEEIILGVTLTNKGRSPATDLAFDVFPGNGFVSASDPILIDVISPGSSRQLEIPLRVTGNAGLFEISIRITWDDREQAQKELLFHEQVRLIPAPSHFKPIPNPYSTGRPLIPGSPVFVGRQDIFDFVKKSISGGHLVVLVGERRMGKSSILRQLSTRMGDDWVVAYLDGQGLGLTGGLENWLADIALEISRVAGLHSSPSPTELGSQPGSLFEAFLQQVGLGIGQGRRLLLLFDEFEEIESRVRLGELTPSIFPYLRHLLQFGEAGFLLAGTKRLERLSPEYWTPLFNISLYREIPPLDDASARKLIHAPVEGRLLYDDLAVDKLLRLSGRQPYFLQLLCYALVSYCNREHISYVTTAEVGAAEEDALMLGQAHLHFLWKGASLEGQVVLSALAWLLSSGELGTVEAIAARLRSLDRRQEIGILPETLLQLINLDLLNETTDHRYQFNADLMISWIMRRKII